MRKIRLVYAIKSMPMGGSQTHLVQVLKLLDRRRFAPMLYCLTGEGALLDAVRAEDVPVVDGGMSRGFKGWHTAAGVLRLARFLRRERVQVLHNYLLRANAFGSIAARLARVPVMLCAKRGCHERRGLELIGAKLGNRLADRVTVNSNAVRDFVAANEGCPLEKMTMIPGGVDTDRFQPLPAGEYKSRLGLDPTRPVVGTVTRMRARKGVEEFLHAMAMVCQQQPGVQTAVVGEVDLDADLQRFVAGSALAGCLHLLGRRSDMPEVYSAFDVYVLSSHAEGMSNANLEAMAMGKPVVATDAGGTVEVVRHGHSGLLVPPKAPVPLAAAIADLLAAPSRAIEMGKLGRRIVQERFSVRTMVSQMEALYVELLKQGGVAVEEPVGAASAVAG